MFLFITTLKHYLQTSGQFIIILTCLLFAAPDETEPPVTPKDGIASENTLGNWYTLGRVSGNKTYLNMLSPYIDRDQGGLLLSDFFHTTSGNDRFEGGISFVSVLGFTGYDFLFLGMLPEGDLLFAPTPSSRLSLTMTTPNLSFILSDQFSGSGLEDGFYANSLLQWTFLSNKGEIHVNPDQYETAFYLGPQVNAGQVKTSVSLGNLYNDPNYYSKRQGMFFLYSTATVGILDNFSITSRYSFASDELSKTELSRLNTEINADPINSYTGILHYLYPLKHSASGFLEYRLPMFATKGGYQFTSGYSNNYIYTSNGNLVPSETPNVTSNTFFLDASYLLGTHISSLSQVNGNFDGYFTPILGERQLYVHAFSVLDFTSNLYLQSYQTLQVQNVVRYGVTPFLTIGQYGSIQFFEGSMSGNIALNFTITNIPLRTRGPEAVSKFEYQFGYWPRAGEFRIDGSYNYVDNRGSEESYQSAGSVLSHLNNNSFPSSYGSLNNLQSTSYGQHPPGDESLFASPFIAFSFSTGLSNSCILSNTFEVQTEQFSGTYSSNSYYGGTNYFYESYSTNLWANQFSIHLGNPKQYLHSLSILLAGQNSSEFTGSENFDFLLSYTYTAGF